MGILGSGAMPETGIYIKEWAKEKGIKVRIHSLDVIPSRLELSKTVYESLCGTEDCTFEIGDIRTAPEDLREHDFVYFNAAVGSTTLEKESILLDVVKRMKPGAFVLTRSTNSLKTMAYPVSQTYPANLLYKNELTFASARSDPNKPYY